MATRRAVRGLRQTLRCVGLAGLMAALPAAAQSDPADLYESKFVQAGEIRLHYLDFGGTGVPVIFVHDWYEDAHTWTSFAPPFADAYRVLAMTRRGYGESDDVGWGYDVATQSEDILDFMDALGIERAVLVGRHPTTQDMTWIAEHHPERLAGLVYLYHAMAPSPGEGRVLRDRTFAEMMMRYGGCWMGEEAYHRSAPRLLYRPDYIGDSELRIEVPAISFTHPQDFAAGAGDMEFLDLTLQMATGADPGGGYCDPAAIRTSVDYLTALADDPERLAEVRPLVPTREERKRYADAFERAFGPNLRIVRLEQPADYRTDPEPYHRHIGAFLEEVARREAARNVDPAHGPTVFHVAPPTGEEADRASILAALEEVQRGDTIQFAPGTYLVGEIVPVSIPQITILGHPEGTVLRGCELPAYEEMMEDLGRARDWSGRWAAMSRCGILELTGGRVTVRNLTFEYTDRGLGLGCCLGEPAFRPSDGGYRIENNTFRNSSNGIRASLASADTTVIRRNQFINVYHAVSAAVSHFHVVDNDISVPEPEQVPGIPHPGFAIGLEPVPPGPGGTVTSTINVCEHNVVAGNRIEGHPDGIVLFARPGTRCRHNVIRDNTIAVRRVRLPASRPYVGPARITSEADSTVVGVPLALFNDPVPWVGDDSAPQGIFESNRIEGNRITGAEGLGIAVYRASRNRIVDNTITGVTARDPYPGNTIRGSRPEEWDEANGSGIWISPGSDENEIRLNILEDVASHAVFLEGDSNRVELQSADHTVRDLGRANRVDVATTPAPAAADSAEVRARIDDFLAALSDDSPTFVAPFYATDAVLVLPGGAVLHGREAIVRGFLHPRVPPLRGVRALSEELVGGGDTVTWEGAIAVRVAPAPDTIRGALSATGELAVPDSATRAYFLRLASDEAAQAEVRAVYRDLVAPAHRAAEQRFMRAFGEYLRMIPLEERAIGYGYREAPEVIEPHIRRFLDEVGEWEGVDRRFHRPSPLERAVRP